MKTDILERILELKAVAVIRLDSDKNIFGMTEALKEGGISVVEITLTTPNALEIIEKLSSKFGDEVIVGVGSVLSAESAIRSINAGAKYVVSPIMKSEIITVSHERNVPAMIGAFSPTEIQTAHELGADIIKVFPADVLGMKFFKGVLAPMPHLKLMPTGGVNLENPGEWLKAGACAVGIGSALIDKQIIEDGKFEILRNNAAKVIESLKKL